jgi:hypothetical protein
MDNIQMIIFLWIVNNNDIFTYGNIIMIYTYGNIIMYHSDKWMMVSSNLIMYL